MKLEIVRENLSKAVSCAVRFTSIKAQLPVLSNLRFIAKANKLTISATNLETSINISLGAKVTKKGEITAPARTINDILSNLSSQTVKLEQTKEQILLTSGKFKSKILAMNAADFPSVPTKVGKGSVTFDSNKFSEALSSVLFSVSSDETRPILTGVLMNFDFSSVTFVSTDGFRLTEKKLGIKTKLKDKIIIPKSSLSEMGKLIGESEKLSLSYSASNKQIIFSFDNIVLSSRVIAGDFPDYKARIPSSSKINIITDKEEFLQAIKLSGVFAKDASNIVRIKAEKDSLVFEAESSSAGSQENSINAKVIGGEVEIAFNYRFLEEVLNAIDGEEVKIELNDKASPGVFRDPKDSNFLHLIMPVKVQD